MTKHLVWSASYAWLVLMAIVWDLFVPKGLSVGTFTLLTLAGALGTVHDGAGGGRGATGARQGLARIARGEAPRE